MSIEFITERILSSIIAIAIGVITLKYNYQIAGMTGPQDWIERWMGAGSTYGFFKFLSIIIVLAGILNLAGLLDNLMFWLLSPLINIFRAN